MTPSPFQAKAEEIVRHLIGWSVRKGEYLYVTVAQIKQWLPDAIASAIQQAEQRGAERQLAIFTPPIEKFIEKVETGKARSKVTYEELKAALAAARSALKPE